MIESGWFSLVVSVALTILVTAANYKDHGFTAAYGTFVSFFLGMIAALAIAHLIGAHT